MDEESVREVKTMIGGTALMSSGAALYTASAPFAIPMWFRFAGFIGLLVGIVLLVVGASGY